MFVQIRAQLAAEGHPLLGDTMYEPLASSHSPDVSQDMAQMSMNSIKNPVRGGPDCSNIDSTDNVAHSLHVKSREQPMNETRSLNSISIDVEAFKGNAPVGPSEDVRVGQDSVTGNRSVRLLNEPSAWGIGLQACRIEVHDPNDIMGPSPAVFEAPVPWWRDKK